MKLMDLLGVIAQLENWAPGVLALGPEASEEDLEEILRLRIIVDKETPRLLQDHPAPFFAILRADRACMKFCASLLYLPKESAGRLSEEFDAMLAAPAWYGVHFWEIVEFLAGWGAQLSEDAHPAEILQAFLDLFVSEGKAWVNTAFIGEDGSFNELLSEEALVLLLEKIREGREARLERKF